MASRLVHRLTQQGAVQIARLRQQVAPSLHIVGDRRQRLVEFMRERRGERAHCGYARGMAEFSLQVLHPPLCLLTVGQITNEAGKQLFALIKHFAHRQFDRKSGPVLAAGRSQTADTDDPFFPRFLIMGEIAVMPLAIWRGHEHRDIFAQHIGFGILEHALRRWTE